MCKSSIRYGLPKLYIFPLINHSFGALNFMSVVDQLTIRDCNQCPVYINRKHMYSHVHIFFI